MRLLYSCSELGLGHASRTLALGKRLEKNGHEIFFFSGARAYQLLQQEFKNVYPCHTRIMVRKRPWNNHNRITHQHPVSHPRLQQRNKQVRNQKLQRHGNNPPLLRPTETHKRNQTRPRNLRRRHPRLTNGTQMALSLSLHHEPHQTKLRILTHCSTQAKDSQNATSKTAHKIIIPDNPPPYTISEYNIGNLDNIGINEKVEFVGSFIDTTPVKGSEEHVFAPISGPFGTRAKLTNLLIPAPQRTQHKKRRQLRRAWRQKNRANQQLHRALMAFNRRNGRNTCGTRKQ